jgi:hypothetical protein
MNPANVTYQNAMEKQKALNANHALPNSDPQAEVIHYTNGNIAK